MTAPTTTLEYNPFMAEEDLEIEVAGLSAIEFLDEFLRTHSERGMFSRREVVDLLLDLRFILQESSEKT